MKDHQKEIHKRRKKLPLAFHLMSLRTWTLQGRIENSWSQYRNCLSLPSTPTNNFCKASNEVEAYTSTISLLTD